MAEQVTSPGYKWRVAIGKQGSSAAWDGADSTAGILAEVTETGTKPEIRTNYLPGAVGHISQSIGRRRLGTKGGRSNFRLGVAGDQAGALLELAFGKVSSGTYSFDKTVELPCYTVFEDKDFGGTDVYKMNNGRCRRAVFTSSQDDPHLMMAVEMLGSTVVAGATFPSSGFASPAELILQHYECVLTMGGATQKPVSIELTIDHQLTDNVYRNSRDRLGLPRGRRLITGVVELDWNSAAKALADLWLADTAFTFNLAYTITGGTRSITFASASSGCKFDGELPDGAAENFTNTVRFPFTFYNVAAGGDDELTAVLTS